MIIKLEKLNKCYSEAMTSFFGLNIELEGNANQSSQKKISNIYSELKQSIKFTEDQLNKLYKHKYTYHFYTSEEIKDFKKKWSKV